MRPSVDAIQAGCAGVLASFPLPAEAAFAHVDAVPPGTGWLGPAERAQLPARAVEKRRREWLAGRWVARLAASRLEPGDGRERPAGHIECVTAADGSPSVWREGAPCRVTAVTVSHAGGLAAAVAWRPRDTPRLGLDIEPLVPPDLALHRVAFAEDDLAYVASANDECEQMVRALALWTAKEAVAKALRIGLRTDLRAIRIAPAAWGAAWTATAAGEAMLVRHARVEGYLVAVAAGG